MWYYLLNLLLTYYKTHLGTFILLEFICLVTVHYITWNLISTRKYTNLAMQFTKKLELLTSLLEWTVLNYNRLTEHSFKYAKVSYNKSKNGRISKRFILQNYIYEDDGKIKTKHSYLALKENIIFGSGYYD